MLKTASKLASPEWLSPHQSSPHQSDHHRIKARLTRVTTTASKLASPEWLSQHQSSPHRVTITASKLASSEWLSQHQSSPHQSDYHSIKACLIRAAITASKLASPECLKQHQSLPHQSDYHGIKARLTRVTITASKLASPEWLSQHQSSRHQKGGPPHCPGAETGSLRCLHQWRPAGVKRRNYLISVCLADPENGQIPTKVCVCVCVCRVGQNRIPWYIQRYIQRIWPYIWWLPCQIPHAHRISLSTTVSVIKNTSRDSDAFDEKVHHHACHGQSRPHAYNIYNM